MADQYTFLVVKYPGQEVADQALAALGELSREKVVKLRDAVVITKTDKGKIKLHQTKDDSIGKGLVKGGAMGVLFAAILGPAGWIAMGAAAGGLFASFDRGIKNKILRELGDGMTSSESALALLVERADWQIAMERMRSHGFGGQLVVSEVTPEDMAAIEKVLADPTVAEAVPEEMDVPAPIDAPAVAPVVLVGQLGQDVARRHVSDPGLETPDGSVPRRRARRALQAREAEMVETRRRVQPRPDRMCAEDLVRRQPQACCHQG